MTRNDIPSLMSQGVAHLVAEDFVSAQQCFEAVLRIDGSIAEAMSQLGAIHLRNGDMDKAEVLLQQALRLNPADSNAHNNLGVIFSKTDRLEEALAHYDKAIELGRKEIIANRANTLILLHRYDEALKDYRQAERQTPFNPDIFRNQEMAHLAKRNYARALWCLDRALALRPDYAEAYHSKAVLLLMMGQFKEGWRLLEWRWRMDEAKGLVPDFGCPLWLGETPIHGRKILLWAEQGLGDMIQFLRFVPHVVRLGAEVTVCIPKTLMALAASAEPAATIVPYTARPPGLDFYTPFMSLPQALGLEATEVAPVIPYIQPRDSVRARWRTELGPRRRKRVGLIWFGSMRGSAAATKSMAFEDIRPLLDAPAEFYSLQKQNDAESAAFQRDDRVTDLWDKLTDFEETAGAMMELDLIISIDTSTAHMAGALGRPLWVMLHQMPEWRWPDHGTTPWYPTARLFRQSAPGDWAPVIENIRVELLNWLATERDAN